MPDDGSSETLASMHETLMRLIAAAEDLADTLLAVKLSEVADVVERALRR